MTFDDFLIGIMLSALGLVIAGLIGGYVKDEVSKVWGWVIIFAGVELTVCVIVVMIVLMNTVGAIQ